MQTAAEARPDVQPPGVISAGEQHEDMGPLGTRGRDRVAECEKRRPLSWLLRVGRQPFKPGIADPVGTVL
jgi:hypothetical protein